MTEVLLVSSLRTLKMACFVLALLCFSGLTDAGQERVKMLNFLEEDLSPELLQSLSHHHHIGSPVALSVDNQQLTEISLSVLTAESWVKNHVLAHYPGLQITTIVVGNSVLCNNNYENKWDLVLPSVKNIYYSLVRWGLEKDIKVSAALSTECLHPFSYSYRDDLANTHIKPLLEFLYNTNSTFSMNAPLDFSPLVTAHEESSKKLGFHKLNGINVLVSSSLNAIRPKSRKLSFLSSSNGLSVPASIAKSPLPPLAQTPPAPFISTPYSPETSPSPFTSFPFAPQATPLPPLTKPTLPPPLSSPFTPQRPPPVMPSNPPDVFSYPPCYAPPAATPAPTARKDESWCVAKPSVPEENLKEAMDYACGAGGAACEEIAPHGSCYYPDTMVAHASYAFNSYWQKNKKLGGSCSFGGTAMVINANPSFQHCRFILS